MWASVRAESFAVPKAAAKTAGSINARDGLNNQIF
jgi:hypothetical protein